MDSIWNDYDKLLVTNLSYRMEVAFLRTVERSALNLEAPRQWAFISSILYLVMYCPLSFPPFDIHFEHGYSTLPQTIEGLKIGEAPNSLRCG